VPTWTK